MSSPLENLTQKIAQLPPERIAEVVDFIDFISEREHDRAVTRAAQSISESSLAGVWDNDADAIYDRL